MAALKPRRSSGAFAWLAACLTLASLSPPQLQASESPSSLFAQAAATALDRSFPSPKTEYLLLDLHTRKIVASRWHRIERPIPVGSLLKPFVALAYGRMQPAPQFPAQFPVVQCHGTADGCWRAAGHGPMSLERAIGQSCNAYFLALATTLSASSSGIDSLRRTAADYALPPPPTVSEPQNPRAIARMWVGLTPDWRMAPLALAKAYAKFTTETHDEVAQRIVAGMRLAAKPGGTAARVSRFAPVSQYSGGLLAKTGTAPCIPDPEIDSGRCLINGDGLVVILTPAQNPDRLLLVRQRGTTGAQTAELAGKMLATLEVLRAPAP